MNMRDEANARLKKIASIQEEFDRLTAECEAALEKVRQEYGPVLRVGEGMLKDQDAELMLLMKTRQADIFDGRDKIVLQHGVLLHTQERKVSIPRNALEAIEAEGWTEAVKIAKSVDRGVVEKWPDERLLVIGAARKLVHKFAWELLARAKA